MFFKKIGFATLVLFLFVFFSRATAIQLWQDASVESGWELAQNVRVTKASCERFNHLLSDCDVQYEERRSGETVTGSLPYIMVVKSWEGEQIAVLRSKANPAVFSTNVGVRDLRWRVYSFAFWVGLAPALLIWVMFFQKPQSSPAAARAASQRVFEREQMVKELLKEQERQAVNAPRQGAVFTPPARAVRSTFGQR